MASRPVVADAQEGFSGGVNAQGLSRVIAPNECAAMTNVRVVRDGEIAKRPGFRLVQSEALLVNHLHWWRGSSSLGEVVYVDSAFAVHVGKFDVTTGTLTSTSSTGPTTVGGRSAAVFRDAAGNNVLYMTGAGGGKVYKHPANTNLGAGTPANIGALWVYNQRLFGCTTTDSTIYWSALNDGDTLGDTANGGGSATVRTFNSQAIRGGFAFGPTNYIVHDSAISAFTGRSFDDIQIQAGTQGVSPGFGGLYGTPWSVIDGTAYLLTNRGLVLITADGQFVPYATAEREDPIARTIATAANVGYCHVTDNARAGEVWLHINFTPQTFGTNNWIYIYSKRLQRITGIIQLEFDVAGITAMVAAGSVDNFSVNPQLLLSADFGHGSSKGIFGCDFSNTALEVYQDASMSYASSVQCRRFFTPEPTDTHTKAWRRVLVAMGNGANPLATADAYGTATSAVLGYTTPVGGAVSDATVLRAQAMHEIQASGTGPYIDVTISDGSSATAGWSVRRIQAQGFDYGDRGY